MDRMACVDDGDRVGVADAGGSESIAVDVGWVMTIVVLMSRDGG